MIHSKHKLKHLSRISEQLLILKAFLLKGLLRRICPLLLQRIQMFCVIIWLQPVLSCIHFQYIEVVRTVELKNKMFERMCSLTTTVLQFQHALSMHPVRLESVSEWTNVSIFISAHGEVCNLIYALKTRCKHLCNVVSIWRVLYSEHAVQQPWEHLSEVVPLSDLFAFTALGARTKKSEFEGQ